MPAANSTRRAVSSRLRCDLLALVLAVGPLSTLTACGGETAQRDEAAPAGGRGAESAAEAPSPGESPEDTGVGSGAPDLGDAPAQAGPESLAIGAAGASSVPASEPALLGPVEVDSTLGLAFRAPAPFQRAGGAFVARARQALEQSAGATTAHFTLPRMIFAIPQTDARIFVGEFVRGGSEDAAAWERDYLEGARAKAGTAGFTHDRIRAGDRDALFIRIEAESYRNDRIVFSTSRGNRAQIDYLLPRSRLAELEAAVDASIRSVRAF